MTLYEWAEARIEQHWRRGLSIKSYSRTLPNCEIVFACREGSTVIESAMTVNIKEPWRAGMARAIIATRKATRRMRDEWNELV